MLPLPTRFSEVFLDTFSLQGCSQPVRFASLPHIRPLSLMFDGILMDMNGNLELCFNLFLYVRFVNDIFIKDMIVSTGRASRGMHPQSCDHTYDPFITLLILPNFSASRIIPPILESDKPNFSFSDASESSAGFFSTISTTIRS